ncbi:MAG: hypothetical protein RLZZ396_212, partial [Planctomycetota bacterium]
QGAGHLGGWIPQLLKINPSFEARLAILLEIKTGAFNTGLVR